MNFQGANVQIIIVDCTDYIMDYTDNWFDYTDLIVDCTDLSKQFLF